MQINTVVAVIAASGSAVAAPEAVASPATDPATPAVDASAAEQASSPAESGAGTKVLMPQMGESITEGTITKWLKKVGETVERDEPLFEISTDKVDAEIPSPVAGTVTEIKFPEGSTVTINTVVAVIGGGAGKSAAAAPAKPAAGAPAPAAAPAVAAAAVESAAISAGLRVSARAAR